MAVLSFFKSVSARNKVAVASEAISPAVPSSQSTQKALLNDSKNPIAIKRPSKLDFKVSSMVYCISHI
ncbi:hypothetical protein BG011_002647 [Mortierella polycephala]|uniref:Uncharacterized protein n=1 Tax=Mortierella polycephala TaxID=41804 RepID=A0A9P6U4W9_9FUNG|nr:hypothetical protein BG011_002647 [Mortierella polycephala]